MNKSRFNIGVRALSLGLCLYLGTVLFPTDSVWSVGSPGLSLSIYTEQNQYQFPLGDPIKLTLVVKNVSGQPQFTERGFSKIEIHRSVVVTDPAGNSYYLDKAPLGHVMPPPFFWQGQSWGPAEVLPADFVRSATITDITEFVPTMKTTPGWYTLEMRLQFIHFAKTEQLGKLGLLGALGDPENWIGTLYSRKVQVYISPQLGGQLKVRVVDKSSPQEKPLAQIPVRVFNLDTGPPEYEPAQLWSSEVPILEGSTDFEGWAAWKSGAPCKPKPQDKYVAVAYYQGQYKAAAFSAQEEGWAQGCSTVLEKTIRFGDLGFPSLSGFSIFGLKRVWIQAGAVVSTGQIGVREQGPGFWLDSGVEILIGMNVRVEDRVGIYGDTIKIWWGASVDDVFYNDIQNNGTIRGEAYTPLNLPLPVEIPAFPEITPGKKKVRVPPRKVTTLSPGSYRDVSVGNKGTLKLKEGVYHFRELELDAYSNLVCLGPGPTEIRIKECMDSERNVKIGPSPQSGLGGRDMIFYIEGQNKRKFDFWSGPKAVRIGDRNEVKASMFVPNGTLVIGHGSTATGAFVAEGVIVGARGKIALESGF